MLRTAHGCADQACDVKILLANPDPSTMADRSAVEGLELTSGSGSKRKYLIVMPTASDSRRLEWTTVPSSSPSARSVRWTAHPRGRQRRDPLPHPGMLTKGLCLNAP